MKKIDELLAQGGRSEYGRILTSLIWGFNHRNTGIVGLENDDIQGQIFITRPEFNLSYDNLKNVPEFDFLWNGGPYSMGAVIRAYLDPINSRPGGEAYTPLVDHRNPFIPLLSNLCLDFSGVPDIMARMWTSDGGRYDEQYFIPSGLSGVRNVWDANINFKNVKGDPITALFFVWVTYINRIAEDSMQPFERNLIEDELDSTCRIYRFPMEVTGQKFTKSACSIASIPTASTIGSAFDMSANVTYSEANKTISVPFTNIGAWYMDSNIYDAFNRLVVNWNPAMRPHSDGTISGMQRLTNAELKAFNWFGYPYIDPISRRIDWYVDIDDYEMVMKSDDTLANIRLNDLINTSLLEETEARFARLANDTRSAIVDTIIS